VDLCRFDLESRRAEFRFQPVPFECGHVACSGSHSHPSSDGERFETTASASMRRCKLPSSTPTEFRVRTLRRAAHRVVVPVLVALAGAVARAECQDESTPTFRLVADLRIGSEVGSGPTLTWVDAIRVDPRGRMFVAQPQQGSVLVFDTFGKRTGRLGHEGEGPGEFRTISQMGWLGDSLWVVDARLGRATLFGPDAANPTTFPAGTSYPYPFSRSVAAALLEHGHAVLPVSVSLPALVSGDRRRAPVLLVDRNMAPLDTLATVDLTRSRLVSKTPDGGMLVSSQQPYDDSPLVRTGDRGREIVVVERSVAPSASVDSFRVTALDSDGRQMWSRWLQFTPQRVNPDQADSLIDQLAQDFASSFTSRADARRAVQAGLFVPPFEPPVTDCVVGHDGIVWLRRDVFAADGMSWTVLDPDGTSMARVRSSGPIHLFDASSTRAWGVEYSSLDVPFVVRYRLERVGSDR